LFGIVEGLFTPDVADGIDAPGDVLHEKDAHQAAPDGAGNETSPRVVEKAQGNAGENDAQADP
jgi:hypothetical protein